ncbi:MAG: HIT family protein [Gammaproteobacteria bacterium]
MAFELDPHLVRESTRLGRLGGAHLLLMHEAAVPWFLLVPETTAVELCDLDAGTHAAVFGAAHDLGRFVRTHFAADKLNVAAIGNIVRQLHVHVIGRRVDDPWWPGTVWGQSSGTRRDAAAVAAIRSALATALPAFETATHG